MTGAHGISQGRFGTLVDSVEEGFIAITLGLMTIVTFANVVARYFFNSNILWALEVTVVLFGWLVLVGASYGIKKHFHIGIDVVINLLPKPYKKLIGLVAVAASLVFALMLLKGSWDYWYPFITKRAFLETNDIPMPDMLQFLATWFNDGERYEKLPRFVVYAALPLGMALLTIRLMIAGWHVITDQRDSIIAAHEVEELLEEVTDAHADGPHHNQDRALAKMKAAADQAKKED